MARLLLTRSDAIWHTLRRVAVAVTSSAVFTLILTVWIFGADPDASIRAGVVVHASVWIAVAVSALLTAALSYSSAMIMQQLALAREELWRISRCDQLTGLLNGRGFDEAASLAVRTALRSKSCTTILMCDIDRFKSINDRFGHDFGDRVLIELAATMKELGNGRNGITSRHGGEEFAMLLIGVTAEQSLVFAEHLRRGCARSITHETFSAEVSISIGLASAMACSSLPQMMREADGALYAAKRRGRNQVARAAFVSA